MRRLSKLAVPLLYELIFGERDTARPNEGIDDDSTSMDGGLQGFFKGLWENFVVTLMRKRMKHCRSVIFRTI